MGLAFVSRFGIAKAAKWWLWRRGQMRRPNNRGTIERSLGLGTRFDSRIWSRLRRLSIVTGPGFWPETPDSARAPPALTRRHDQKPDRYTIYRTTAWVLPRDALLEASIWPTMAVPSQISGTLRLG